MLSTGYVMVEIKEKIQAFSLFAKSSEERYTARVQALCDQIRQIQYCAEQDTSVPIQELKKWEQQSSHMLKSPHPTEEIAVIEEAVMQFRKTYLDKLLCLSPIELNAMLGFLPEGYKKEKETIVKHILPATSELQSKTYWKKDEKHGKRFYTFTVSKDESDPRIKQNLFYIVDVINNFKKEVKDDKAILLLPMLQCKRMLSDYVDLSFVTKWTGWNMEKSHMVLVEVNLEKKCIEVHDANVRWNTYADVFVKAAPELGLEYDPVKHYHAYGVQKDHVLCGYYASKYHASILEKGDASECQKVVLNESQYTTKLDFLRSLWSKWGEEEVFENHEKRERLSV